MTHYQKSITYPKLDLPTKFHQNRTKIAKVCYWGSFWMGRVGGWGGLKVTPAKVANVCRWGSFWWGLVGAGGQIYRVPPVPPAILEKMRLWVYKNYSIRLRPAIIWSVSSCRPPTAAKETIKFPPLFGPFWLPTWWPHSCPYLEISRKHQRVCRALCKLSQSDPSLFSSFSSLSTSRSSLSYVIPIYFSPGIGGPNFFSFPIYFVLPDCRSLLLTFYVWKLFFNTTGNQKSTIVLPCLALPLLISTNMSMKYYAFLVFNNCLVFSTHIYGTVLYLTFQKSNVRRL